MRICATTDAAFEKTCCVYDNDHRYGKTEPQVETLVVEGFADEERIKCMKITAG
jgi:hypothetical protein